MHIGVVATPAESAQDVCDRLVAAGITSVLNFAPCVLDVPDHVMVRKVDLSTELQILAFHEQRQVATRLAAAASTDADGPDADEPDADEPDADEPDEPDADEQDNGRRRVVGVPDASFGFDPAAEVFR